MKTLLSGLFALLLAFPAWAAQPPIQRNYYTTNDNPGPIVTPGGDTYITNLTVVSNAYFNVSYVTNLFTTTNISYVDFVTWAFITNLTVVSNAYFYETNFSSFAYTTNLFVESNAFFYSTNFENNTYVTNLYVTSNSVFFETNFVNNSFITNLTVVSNAYFPKNMYVSNLFVTNIENAPGPFVLLPHASTNGFPNALSLSNGNNITFSTNGQFLKIDAASGGPVATNTIEYLASPPTPGTSIVDVATSQWKWFTNVIQTNTQFVITNLVVGADTTIRFKGDTATDWNLTWIWPPSVVANWLTATQTYVLSNHITIVSIQVWNSTNILVAGKDEP